ncbi:MAG: ABC transporter ATP-binding protein [Termitinemataceae bacterium]|nr:MAG: ABC transporter ATP-binding protein [Termitinemataceae bacterium]
MGLLEVLGISVVYPGSGEGHVIENLSFSVDAGEKIALIGANGAGKSTLMLALVGLLPLHDGEVKVENVLLNKKNLSFVRQKLGLVFQNPDDQLFMPTVFEDVLFGPKNYAETADSANKNPASKNKNVQKAIEDKALSIMENLEIAHLKDRMSHKLSGGEKRLAALASVLSTEPSMLLMDEPSAFLDPRARRRLISVICTLSQACLIATHDLDFARLTCSRCLILNKGGIYRQGAIDNILDDKALLEECGL